MSSSNNTGGCTYRFIESSLSTLPIQANYDLEIRQQPERAKVSLINERDRRPIEPPPILQLHWDNCSEEELKKYLQSPFYFTVANLVTEEDPETPLLPVQDYMSGSTVSSLYRLRDIDNSDGGFFVFGDLAVKKEGKFKLRFSLFEIVDGQVQNRRTILSDTFTVFIPKQFPGPVEATFLSRTFSDQGVKMRIRKEHRLQSRKRKVQHDATSASSANSTLRYQPTKRYQSRSTKMIVSSPSYAEQASSSSSSTSDVFFGRWQATTRPSNRAEQPLSSHMSTPPPQQAGEEVVGLTDKFKYQHSEEHLHTFPSPESTIYHATPSSTTPIPRSMSWGYRYSDQEIAAQQSKRPASSHGSWPVPSGSTYTHVRRSPELIASTHFTDSPPPMTRQLPEDPLLAKYHTCSDRKSSRDEANDLPTPPSIADIHQAATGTQTWGTRLPPLRAIMSGSDTIYDKKVSCMFPLLLPPPVAINSPMNGPQQHPYYYH